MMKDRPHHLTIDYRMLGTITLKEFRQAVLTDLAALENEFHVDCVTAPKMVVPITNEYGDPISFSALTDRTRRRIDTHHYRPACKDYDL